MPFPLQIAIVFLAGTLLGSLINLAIYRLALFEKQCFSPWGPKHPEASPRRPWDFLPIIGWFSLKREEKLFGVGYWTRPFAIEFGFGAALAGLFFWEFAGGMQAGATDANYWTWFLLHGFLLVLLTTATFIDFDEKTIPDQITVTGTLVALAYAALVPSSRLTTPAGKGTFSWLHCQSPEAFPPWAESDQWGFLIAISVFVFWCIALLPMPHRIKFGKYGTVKYFFAIMIRPPRKTKNTSPRKPSALLFVMPLIALLGVAAISVAKMQLDAIQWESLFSALMGMTFGLLFVWAIRLIAGFALAKEAMGFGDVTLMAMIGAFLGWQAALLTFAFAPFAAVFIAIAQFITSKKPDIAFGPYLSLGAVFVIVGWSAVWKSWALPNIFIAGNFVLVVIAAALVLMYVMLTTWSYFRNRGEPE